MSDSMYQGKVVVKGPNRPIEKTMCHSNKIV